MPDGTITGSLSQAVQISGAISRNAVISGKISGNRFISGTITVGGARDIPAYTGDYTVTPGEEPIVLATSGLKMTGNVTVEKIPPNYGLITWNGSTLMVT